MRLARRRCMKQPIRATPRLSRSCWRRERMPEPGTMYACRQSLNVGDTKAKSNACLPSVIVVLASALIRQLQNSHTRKFQWSGAGAHVSTGAAGEEDSHAKPCLPIIEAGQALVSHACAHSDATRMMHSSLCRSSSCFDHRLPLSQHQQTDLPERPCNP